MTATLDISPTLLGARISLRPISEDDREPLYLAANDPAIWAQHPASNRHERSVFDPYFDNLLGAGGTLVARELATDRVIGCSQFYEVPDQPGEYGIGFTFLARSHWGGQWNREMKALMVAHVLRTCPRVWFHIGPENMRSQIATTRLGAQFVYDADLEIGLVVGPYKCYTLTIEDWLTATGQSLEL